VTTEQSGFEFEPEGENQARTGPVTCLGMTFDNDEARRKYFTEKLQDPEFRKTEVFSIGEDEDILNLSELEKLYAEAPDYEDVATRLGL